MPVKLTGLTKRNRTYEVRFAVPKDIRDTFKRKEVVKSLKTRDHEEAVRRYFDTVKSIQAEFDAHRQQAGLSPLNPPTATPSPDRPKLTGAARRKAANDYYSRRFDEERLRRHEQLKAARRDPRAFWKAETGPAYVFDAYVEGKLKFDEAFYHSTACTEAARRDVLERALLIGDCDEFLPLTDGGLDPSDRVKLALDLMATELKVLRDLEIPSELVTPTPDPITPTPTPAPSAAAATNAPTFSDALKKWLNQNNGKRWTQERKIECEKVLLDFIELAGERQIDQFTAAHGRTYKDALTVLPASWRKRKNLRDLSLKEVVKKAPGLGYPVQSAETINQKLTIAKQFFTWCKTEFADFKVTNPVEGFKIDKDSGANEEVDPFSIDELNAIFQTPPFTGAKSDRFWQQPGPDALRDSEKFWLPLLGLWTGARLNELCQITSGHVRQHNGVHYIALTRELRLKKNPGMKQTPSIRNVPIHQKLIDCGFLDFVATRPGKLFPDLPQHSSGRHSDAPSKWFQRFLAVFKIKKPKIKFQSFRHNFIAAATSRGLPYDVRERLVGHVLEGQANRYGNDFVAEQADLALMLYRNEELQKVSYPGLRIEHLFVRSINA